MDRVGVLLNEGELRRIVAGLATYEKARLYTQAAKEMGIGVVFFSVRGVRRRTRQIVGYVPQGLRRYKRVVVPVPKAIHRRGLFYDKRSKDRRKVLWLMSQDTQVYNGFACLDKFNTHRVLAEDPVVREHLPETFLLRQLDYRQFCDLMQRWGEAFLKPRGGTVGIGIVRIRRLKDGRWQHQTASGQLAASLRTVWQVVRRRKEQGYIIQQGVNLARYQGERYDLRVPVQRGETGQWVVPGAVAKRARRTSFLTNLARGGSAHPSCQVLAESVAGVEGPELYARVQRLALAVGEAIGKRFPAIADLGLDIGLDQAGKPWLIEVNRRDLRYSFLAAGDYATFQRLYANPMAYGKYLIERADTDRATGSLPVATP